VASGEGFVSVRSAAGEGEAGCACETSFAEDFAAADLEESRDESRLGEDEFGFVTGETPVPAG